MALSGYVRIAADDLRVKTAAVLVQAGLRDDDAAQAVDVLVAADLRGVESHGVSNMLGSYLDWLGRGHANARPDVRVVRQSRAGANLDGDRGLGVVVAPRAMDRAIGLARECGVGVVTISNTRHLGMAAYHAMRAITHDMIGICMTTSGPRVLPAGGRDILVGTNPIAIAAPSGDRPPFVFDAATSGITSNRVKNLYRSGAPLPPLTVADEEGVPIEEPSAAPKSSDDARLLPLGSTVAAGAHKGYGLAMMVEFLAVVLSGSPLMIDLGKSHACHFLLAIDVEAFTSVTGFHATADRLFDLITCSAPAAGSERVLLAGQPEWEMEQDRRAHGIPIHPQVISRLDALYEAAGQSALGGVPQ